MMAVGGEELVFIEPCPPEGCDGGTGGSGGGGGSATRILKLNVVEMDRPHFEGSPGVQLLQTIDLACGDGNPQNLQDMGLAFNNARDKLYVVVPDPVDSDGDGVAEEYVVLGIPVITSGSASNKGRLDEDPSSWDVINVGSIPTDVAFATAGAQDWLFVTSLGSAYPQEDPELTRIQHLGGGTYGMPETLSLQGFRPLSVAVRSSSTDNSAVAILAGRDATTGLGGIYRIEAFQNPIPPLPESLYRTSGLARRATVMGQ